MKIENETLNELDAWCRQESPMTKFVRSLRLEVAEPDQTKGPGPASTKFGGVEGEKTPFDDIDLDSLPDDQAKHITKAKEAFVAQQKSSKELASKSQQTEQFAREQQARADRSSAILKKHNLDEASSNQPDPDDLTKDPVYKEMHKTLLADGLKPEMASAYSKMFAQSSRVQREQILKELNTNLGPLASNINEVHADKLYRQVQQNDESGIFDIPEVSKAVQENINLFITNGRTVDEATIKNLAAMAYGAHCMSANKEGRPVTAVRPTGNPATPRGRAAAGVLPSFGGNFSGHHAASPQSNGGDPIAANAETAAAVAATVAHFKVKKGK